MTNASTDYRGWIKDPFGYEVNELINTAAWHQEHTWQGLTLEGVRSIRNAFLEAHLVHARNLLEFLTTPMDKKKDGQIIAQHFAPGWMPENRSALRGKYNDISTYLSHMDKVRAKGKPGWRPVLLVRLIRDALTDMAKHVKGAAADCQQDIQVLADRTAEGYRKLLGEGSGIHLNLLDTSTSPTAPPYTVTGTTGWPPNSFGGRQPGP